MKQKETMTATECAKLIEVPYHTLATWLQKGQVPGAAKVKVAGYEMWEIPDSALDHLHQKKRPKRQSSESLTG